MHEALSYLLHLGYATFLALAALLPIVNPIASAALFLALTQGQPPLVQQTLSRKIAVNSATPKAVSASFISAMNRVGPQR